MYTNEVRLPPHWMWRRWSLKNIYERLRMPIRRRRWLREQKRIAQGFIKANDVCANSRKNESNALVIGQFSGNTGLSRASLYDLEHIKTKHRNVFTFDILRPSRICDGGNRFDYVYFLIQPDVYPQFFEYLDHKLIEQAYRIGRLVWETDHMPPEFRLVESLLHEVWVPCEFNKNTFEKELSLPIKVIPYFVTAPIKTDIDIRARFNIKSNAFMGVAIMDIWSPERKNPWAHILAWKKAFERDETAQLVIKLRLAKKSQFVLDELVELVGDYRNITLWPYDLSHEEIAALHRSADVYLSLHRSEGYGLNIHEALLCDKPTVATNFSANSEYGPNYPHYYGVNFNLIDYSDWTGAYDHAPNFKWADPDIQQAAYYLRQIRASVLHPISNK